jgi:IclR family transcriptional regulator, acetate operon repressor
MAASRAAMSETTLLNKTVGTRRPRSPEAVQSLERALGVLEIMAQVGGEIGVSELSRTAGLPMPTTHRLIGTLVQRGYVRQLPSRRYALGPRLMFLGDVASQMLRVWALPFLEDLANSIGESANLAVLERDEVVYIAQVASKHKMRMFTEVGGRFRPHATGVGKALLSRLSDDEVVALLSRTGMPAMTPNTITDTSTFIEHLWLIREKGYAVDNEEQEVGVRCVAVALQASPTGGAMSISGPTSRVSEESVPRIARTLKRVADKIAQDVASDYSA